MYSVNSADTPFRFH